MAELRYTIEHRVEENAVGKNEDIWYIIDTLPRTGKYSTFVGKMWVEKLAEVSVEALNGLRKPKRRRNLQQTRNR